MRNPTVIYIDARKRKKPLCNENSWLPKKATDVPKTANTDALANINTRISLKRLTEGICFTEERNIMLMPIEQGSANPTKPKTNGKMIDEYKDMTF
jgi:hypothetical protein